MQITINGASREVSEDELLFDLPEGEVELSTDAGVVFFQTGKTPTVRPGDWRFDVQRRLHDGSPVRLVAGQGYKLAVSLKPNLEPLETRRPAKPLPPVDPGPTEEELAERALARQIARDIERADMVNEAFDLVMSRLGSAPAPVEPEPPLLPAPDALMSDWGEVGPADDITGDMSGDREEIVSGFIDILKTGRSVVEDAFRQMNAEDRVKLFPLLNAELSRLNNQEALLGRSIPRKAEVESLIGILAKVGEA